MGHHFVFAAPSIEQFWLHEKLGRALLRRGHRISLLATDIVTQRCFALHGSPTPLLRPSRASGADVPLEDFAGLELRARGERSVDALRKERRRLERFVAPIRRWFRNEMPDVVVIHKRRDGLSQLIAHLAEEARIEVVHIGEGLLPGTLQLDSQGLDGQSSLCDRPASFYRETKANRQLIDEALAATVGEATRGAPFDEARPVMMPDDLDRLALRFRGFRNGSYSETRNRIRAWLDLAQRPAAPTEESFDGEGIPDAPFVAVLVQHPDDLRVRLDAGEHPPSPADVVAAAYQAANEIETGMNVIAISPAGGTDLSGLRGRVQNVVTLPRSAAAKVIPAALAVVTVNDPMGMLGVLAGTPVVHLGRTPYGVPGVATRASMDSVTAAVRQACQEDNLALRHRFATRVLTEDHVWCHATRPDDAGVRQLVAALERVTENISPPPLAVEKGPNLV